MLSSLEASRSFKDLVCYLYFGANIIFAGKLRNPFFATFLVEEGNFYLEKGAFIGLALDLKLA